MLSNQTGPLLKTVRNTLISVIRAKRNQIDLQEPLNRFSCRFLKRYSTSCTYIGNGILIPHDTDTEYVWHKSTIPQFR